jgi:hypothetical protein
LFKYSNLIDFQNYNILRRNQSRREQQFVDPFQEAVCHLEFHGWSYETQDLLQFFTAYAAKLADEKDNVNHLDQFARTWEIHEQ